MRFRVPSALLVTALLCLAPVAVRAAGEVGTQAPDFQLDNMLDTAPDSFSLSGARGSVVVLAFWLWN